MCAKKKSSSAERRGLKSKDPEKRASPVVIHWPPQESCIRGRRTGTPRRSVLRCHCQPQKPQWRRWHPGTRERWKWGETVQGFIDLRLSCRGARRARRELSLVHQSPSSSIEQSTSPSSQHPFLQPTASASPPPLHAKRQHIANTNYPANEPRSHVYGIKERITLLPSKPAASSLHPCRPVDSAAAGSWEVDRALPRRHLLLPITMAMPSLTAMHTLSSIDQRARAPGPMPARSPSRPTPATQRPSPCRPRPRARSQTFPRTSPPMSRSVRRGRPGLRPVPTSWHVPYVRRKWYGFHHVAREGEEIKTDWPYGDRSHSSN